MVFSVIGWTIIHSLWQCLGLLAVLRLVLGLTDVRRSAVRYAAALGVLGLAVAGVLATFFWEWRAFSGVGVSPVVGVVARPGFAAGDAEEVQGLAPGFSPPSIATSAASRSISNSLRGRR